MQYTAGSIAKQLQGEVTGNPDVEVTRLCKLDESEAGGLAFLANTKYEHHLYNTAAAAVLVNKDFKAQQPTTATLIHVNDPYTAFTQLLNAYQAARGYVYKNEGIHASALVSEGATVAHNVTVGAHTVICNNVTIGEGCMIGSQVFIGDDCTIGANSILHPGVKIYHNTVVGKRVVIHSNTVVGSDGFGFAPQADGTFTKIPQIGNVVIGDDVEIGANTVIDRATMGSTRIGNGVKLDNLIQIAHNVEIGANCVIASQTGISGSTKIGAGCHIGGQVGIAGHLTIAPGTQFAARSGVLASINIPGRQWAGAPVQPFKDWLRSNVIFRQLAKREKR